MTNEPDKAAGSIWLTVSVQTDGSSPRVHAPCQEASAHAEFRHAQGNWQQRSPVRTVGRQLSVLTSDDR
jgi:hypothetical protein